MIRNNIRRCSSNYSRVTNSVLRRHDKELMLMTADEVAEIFSVQKRTVLKWIREGTLQSVKLSGKNIRLTKPQVSEFIEKKKTSEPKRVDKKRNVRLPSTSIETQGGEKSTGDSARAIREEMLTWR